MAGYRRNSENAHSWSKWIRDHDDELAAVGVPSLVFESERRWWYFLEHGHDFDPEWHVGLLNAEQASALVCFLRREYPSDEAWCCIGVLRNEFGIE
ncbi:MAG: hypothetical protein AAF517_02890 [Planctomycetota bacterium]